MMRLYDDWARSPVILNEIRVGFNFKRAHSLEYTEIITIGAYYCDYTDYGPLIMVIIYSPNT